MLRRRRLHSNTVCIIGQGHWGEALGSLFRSSFDEVEFLRRDSSPSDWKKSLEKRPLIVIATPFSALPDILTRLHSAPIQGIISASKGIDRDSLLTFSSLAAKRVRVPVASLSGPTFAAEVLRKKPTACVIASHDLTFANMFAKMASTPYFRMYLSSDPVGVEVCGAVKNVLAIACGISDGLGLGMNARAGLLTRGLNELRSLVKLLGGKSETVYGLAGVGDLWLTATGDLSRNRQMGLQLSKGKTLKDALKKLQGTCEGIYTVKQVHHLAEQNGLELPISEQVYRICFKRQNPKRALLELMTRELKAEDSSLSRSR